MQFKRLSVWLIVLAAFGLSACGGAAIDTSKTYSRAVINRGAIVPAEGVRIHEYLNYYDQTLPEPVHEPLAMELSMGSPLQPSDRDFSWLQIGLQAREADVLERAPLNLALVLDVSGSMNSGDKMPYLKRSLRVFLESLRPDDRVAIVVYSDRAHVVHPSSPIGDGWWIEETVARLRPGGRTNLHAGLMKGFKQVQRQYKPGWNNRVLLMTDGIANRGVVDPARIAADAKRYNDRGVQLSTIGLGLDLNDRLLSELAREGQGVYHFIDSAAELDRVFREEVSGLVERVARDVMISIDLPPGVMIAEIVGAKSQGLGSKVQVQLQDMGAGDSQILLVGLKDDGSWQAGSQAARVGLTYFDPFAGELKSVHKAITLSIADEGYWDDRNSLQVERNVAIVNSAKALIEVDRLFEAGRYEQAWWLAAETEAELRSLAMELEDAQLAEDADLFARYQVTLSAALGYQPDGFDDWDDELGWGEEAPIEPPAPTVEVR